MCALLEYMSKIKSMLHNGGGTGIRTLGTLSRPSVFKTGAFDHSATPPTITIYTLLSDSKSSYPTKNCAPPPIGFQYSPLEAKLVQITAL